MCLGAPWIPASAIGLAFDFTEIIKVLQQTFEKSKDAPKALEDIVSQANKVRCPTAADVPRSPPQ